MCPDAAVQTDATIAVAKQRRYYHSEYERTEVVHASAVLLENGEPDVQLPRGKYHSQTLASTVTSQLKGPNLDRHLQNHNEELEEWHRLTEEYWRTLEETSRVPSVEEMDKLIELISKILFFGRLTRVPFKWEVGLSNKDSGTNGYTRLPNWKGEEDNGNWATIVMDPADVHANGETGDRLTGIIGTLLHECIHAFLGIYSCRGVQCVDVTCAEDVWRIVGSSGHGAPYVEVLTYIEVFADSEMCSGVNVGLDSSLMQEWNNSRGLLMEADIQLCHPKYHECIRDFAKGYEDESREFCRKWKEKEDRDIFGDDDDHFVVWS